MKIHVGCIFITYGVKNKNIVQPTSNGSDNNHDGKFNGMLMYIRQMYVLKVHLHCGEMEATQDNNHGGDGGGNIVRVVGYGDATSRVIGGIGDGDGRLSEIFCDDIEEIGDCGGTSSNGQGGSEPPCLVANRTGELMKDNHSVPPFLFKLYLMVDDKATSSIISWGSSCTTFIISDEQQFVTKILPCYFKTSRFANFLSQLKNYGFKKTKWNRLEFMHEQFQEGKLHLLKTIKRKKQQDVINKPRAGINELIATFVKVRDEQIQFSNKIRRFKYDIEQTLLEVQTITNDVINKLLSTETIGQKRTFLNIDQRISFNDIEKDFQSIYNQFEWLGSDVDCLMTLRDLKEKVITGYGGTCGNGCSRGGDDGCHIPKFLHTLYNMVENEEINDLITWNIPYFDSFIISDIYKFETHVLPLYFKHNNFSSFTRQLKIYGFKRKGWEKHEYANEWFQGGRYDLLANIRRRTKNLQLMEFGQTCSKTEVEVFNNRLKTIEDYQVNMSIRLLNYEEQIKSSLHKFKETIINMNNVVDKMIEKSSENHFDPSKKAKHEFEKHTIDNEKGQEPEVCELKIVPRTNNNPEVQYYFQESETVGIDNEEWNRIMMEWMTHALNDASCSHDGLVFDGCH